MIELINHKDGLFSILQHESVEGDPLAIENTIVLSTGELLDLELEIWRAVDKAIDERPSLRLRMKRLRAARGEKA